MTTSPDTLSTTLPADAHCPRCGYEFGIEVHTRCSECGLEIDAAALRAIELQRVQGRSLVLAFSLNIVAALVPAFAPTVYIEGGLPTIDSSELPATALLGSLMAATLAVGGFACAAADPGSRRLWLIVWARSHIPLIGPWLSIFAIMRIWEAAISPSIVVLIQTLVCVVCSVAAAKILRAQRHKYRLGPPPVALVTALVVVSIGIALVTCGMYLILKMGDLSNYRPV